MLIGLDEKTLVRSIPLICGTVATSVFHAACVSAEREPVAEQESVSPEVRMEFLVTDTAEWDCGGNGGSYGILSVNGTRLDTVDLYVGVQPVLGGLIFLPMRSEEDPSFGVFTCPTELVLFDGTEKSPLAELLPMFNGAFSNPMADGSNIYYWGFGDSRLYAIRHDFDSAVVDTTFLTDDTGLLATGNRYQFLMPELDGERVVFSTWPGRTFVLNMEFELISDSVAHR